METLPIVLLALMAIIIAIGVGALVNIAVKKKSKESGLPI